MYSVLVIVQVVVSIALIGLVLIQHGKGADTGAAFGAGASGTVFGSQGSATFLSRVTAALAVGFFACSLMLAVLAPRQGGTSSLADQIEASVSEEPAAPAIPAMEEASAEEAPLTVPDAAE